MPLQSLVRTQKKKVTKAKVNEFGPLQRGVDEVRTCEEKIESNNDREKGGEPQGIIEVVETHESKYLGQYAARAAERGEDGQ